MENKRFAVPEQKNYEYAYNFAYQLACEKLLAIEDLELQCRKTGAKSSDTATGQEILLKYLDRLYKIELPDIAISLVDSDEEVPIREQVLILHYFISATGTPNSGNKITFRELPEGKVYLPTFAKRTTNPLVGYFSQEPELLIETGKKMGGREDEYGDTSVTITAFDRVPVTVLLWKGDDEFPPDGSILFDDSVTDYLSAEDIIVLCEIITWKLIRSSRES